MGIPKALGAAAAALMIGASMSMPSLGQRYSHSFYERPAPEYNGDGRKVAPKVHPEHNVTKRGAAWQRYAAAVRATHKSDLYEDPRDDKYLHSHARQMRGLRRALERAGR